MPNLNRRCCLQSLFGAAAILTGLSLPGHANAADADPAVGPIRAFYDALLAAMKQADQLGVRGRYDKLAPVIRATFDLPAMTRIAVRSRLDRDPRRTADDTDREFTRMTIATYAIASMATPEKVSRLTRRSCRAIPAVSFVPNCSGRRKSPSR